MAGYAIGMKISKGRSDRTVIVAGGIALALLLGSGISYVIVVNETYSGAWVVGVLGSLITVAFASLAFLMAVAGVVLTRTNES